MKTASQSLINLLNTSDTLYPADLITFTLKNGTVLRYTNHDTDLTIGNNVYKKFNFKRGKISETVGISVDSLDLTVYPTDDDLVNGVGFLSALQNGVFDGAYMQLDKFFSPRPWSYFQHNCGSASSFGRSSVRYDSAGNQIVSGTPWFPTSSPGFGKSIMVEEGTTNLAQTDLTKWTVQNNATITDTGTTYNGQKVYKVSFPNGNLARAFFNFNASGQTFSGQFLAKLDSSSSNNNVQLYFRQQGFGTTYSVNSVTLNMSSWVPVSINNATCAANSMFLIYQGSASTPTTVFYLCTPQLEQNPYLTTFQDPSSARASESLSIPSSCASAYSGTIEGLFYCTSMTKRQISSQSNYVFNLAGSTGGIGGISLVHSGTSANWQLTTGDDSGNITSVTVSDSLTPNNTWIQYRVAWSAGVAELQLYNLDTGSKVADVSIVIPKLPSDFANSCYIGSKDGTSNFLNTYHDDIRVSNVFRTEPIGYSTPLSVDLATIFKASHDNVLTDPPLTDYILSKRFVGLVDAPEVLRTSAKITVSSLTQLLNIQMPRNMVQPSCNNTVYDSVCSLIRDNYQVDGTVGSGSVLTTINCDLDQDANYFDYGVVLFTSGNNAGISRAVKTYSPGVIYITLPLPHTPSSGDTFSIVPGCDGTMVSCDGKFNNLTHFKGFPYVPVPEVLL